MTSDLDGTRVYYGAGVDWQATDNLRLYMQVEREHGEHFTREYNVSAGLKWTFQAENGHGVQKTTCPLSTMGTLCMKCGPALLLVGFLSLSSVCRAMETPLGNFPECGDSS